ncbi:MAG TPA: hypothetical protein VFX78_00075, partial [Candidatus Eisenbacteria bacterium]|nr:hypothetical protein [Candidatus Eisenbacteria bacterium]
MNHVWRSAVLCLSTYASVFASAQAQPVGGFIVHPRAEDVWDNPAPFSPEFLSDPTRRAMVSKALRLALKPERLGQV